MKKFNFKSTFELWNSKLCTDRKIKFVHIKFLWLIIKFWIQDGILLQAKQESVVDSFIYPCNQCFLEPLFTILKIECRCVKKYWQIIWKILANKRANKTWQYRDNSTSKFGLDVRVFMSHFMSRLFKMIFFSFVKF